MWKWLLMIGVFVAVAVWYGAFSSHADLTKKIDREHDPDMRRELLGLQQESDGGRAGF